MAGTAGHPSLQLPLISCMQKIVIYETKARYYVVGSNNTETRFRVLKIDRTEPRELNITDDKVEYTQKEIRDLLLMIDVGNRPRVQQRGGNGLSKTVSAFGIVGFVKFLEGYYIVLITKRRKVALIGSHTVYKIEDTAMIYIPNDTVRYSHPEEQRYLKIFQNVDLSSNFYFSYSYDLTHTLQYNMAPCSEVESCHPDVPDGAKERVWTRDRTTSKVLDSPVAEDDVEDASKSFTDFLDDNLGQDADNNVFTESAAPLTDRNGVYGIRMKPEWRYVWNEYMLRGARDQIHPDWLNYMIHGFIAQSNLCVYGRSIYLTLIGRRSNRFAGTRFLKRGANCEGNVANEIETEQIVHDSSTLSLQSGRYTAYVQHRGSIPLHWSQDIAKMVPKPPIMLDQNDPYGYVAGQHFNRLMSRYGAPIIILNLVKKREKKRHESILSDKLVDVIRYLNQFLTEDHAIQYIGFDMARVSKCKNMNVLHRLASIAEYCVKKTGFFMSGKTLHCNEIRPHPRSAGMQAIKSDGGQFQRGVVRTNCVDCLDRTNTAQFAMGKCALAFQLYELGILSEPLLEFDTDCVRMLEELYEDHGDTLALQYGGSQLVHRIKGYRKLSPWTSSSRDIMQTLSRYYSNTFSDAEKQNALNLFLGVFSPQEGLPNLWELSTDFYLHNSICVRGPGQRQKGYCQWWDAPTVQALPLPAEQVNKSVEDSLLVVHVNNRDERVDGYWDYYRPYEITSLDEVYSYIVPNSVRDFMPKGSNKYSPFTVRVQPGRRQESMGPATEVNPNISGKDSTASVSSTGSDGSTSSSDGSDLSGDIDLSSDDETEATQSSYVSLKDLFPTMAQVYGVEIQELDRHNTSIYRKYAEIGTNAGPDAEKDETGRARHDTGLVQKSMFPLDSIYSVEPPTVNAASKEIYATYVRCGQHGAEAPSRRSLQVYQMYEQVHIINRPVY